MPFGINSGTRDTWIYSSFRDMHLVADGFSQLIDGDVQRAADAAQLAQSEILRLVLACIDHGAGDLSFRPELFSRQAGCRGSAPDQSNDLLIGDISTQVCSRHDAILLTQCFGQPARSFDGEECADIDAEQHCELRQLVSGRQGEAKFPSADGDRGNVHRLGKIGLAHAFLLAEFFDTEFDQFVFLPFSLDFCGLPWYF